ncbi:NADPH-dependent F420 reductase [uncultured Amnibacterium sp.]|uniref:NADPH-dependent F420 reductase n=1 Tax=uncultured Amnibacterium sp. TaxID=1631851 RepID=UPI0035C9571F
MSEDMVRSALPKRVAVLGVGRVGSTIARLLVAAGCEVTVAASGDPERIELLTQIIVPGARADWAADAVRDADLVVLAVPLHRFTSVDPAMLAGHVVVDVMNYWAPIDGVQALFEDTDRGSSETVQAHLPGAVVVKAFNHIGYHELEEHGSPAGDPDRQALGVAGDDANAVQTVAALIDAFGYDAVRFDSLAAGRAFQPGFPVFGARLDRRAFAATIDGALLAV